MGERRVRRYPHVPADREDRSLQGNPPEPQIGFPATKARWKAHAIVAPTHSIKTNATRVKSVRTAKMDPATDPARKWNATTDIKAFPSSDAFPQARLG